MRCLILKNDGIGDLILASGLIAALGERFDGQVDLVTCAENREVAEGIEPLRERLYVSRDDLHFSQTAWSLGWLWPRVKPGDAAVLRTLRSRHYDVAISLRRFIRQSTLVLMRSARANRRLCAWQIPTNAPPAMAQRVSDGWERYDGPAHVLSELSYAHGFVEHTLGGQFNATPRLGFCRMQPSSPGTRKVALGMSGNSTNWPNASWIELAMLFSEAGFKLVLVGGDNMREVAAQICQKVPESDNQIGRLSLDATARLLQGCDAFVGNDTGITHLASLVVRKCLVILGGGTFRRFFPWPAAANQTVVYHGMDCFDCEWLCKFTERYCLSLVRPRDAFAAFETMMATEHGAPHEINLNPAVEAYALAWRRSARPETATFHTPSPMASVSTERTEGLIDA